MPKPGYAHVLLQTFLDSLNLIDDHCDFVGETTLAIWAVNRKKMIPGGGFFARHPRASLTRILMARVDDHRWANEALPVHSILA